MTSTATYHPFEGGSVPRNRKKPASSPWLSPARFCLAVSVLIAGLVVTFVAYTVYVAASAVWQGYSVPHLDKHAALVAHQPIPARDGNVVRSFFGPKEAGGVDRFDLKAALWARILKPDVHWFDTPWELMYEATVLENVRIDTKPLHAVQQVRIPQALLHDLASALTVEVTSTFAMLPAHARIDPTLDHHTWRTSRNASVFGIDKVLPPFTSEMRDPPKNVFPRFVANSGTMQRMLLRPSDNQVLVAMSGTNASHVETLFPGRHLAIKSRVTMVRDFPVYDFDAFNQTLLERTAYMRDHCSGGVSGGPACQRTYANVGHFENLIEFDDAIDGKTETASRMGWRYGPFLTTKFGNPGPLDYKHIVGNETEDLVYDWHITWSSVPPGRLGAMSSFLGSFAETMAMPHNRTEYELASAQQMNEFWHVIAGHAEPQATRPVTRGVFESLSGLALLAQEILNWHFWVSRTVSTGISLPMELVASTYLAARDGYAFISNARTDGLGFDAVVILFLLGLSLVPYLCKLSLYLRLEWQRGGPMGWVPVGVTKRKATHAERNSARADAKFDWKARIALGLATVVISRFAPTLPHLISSRAPAQPEKEAALLKAATTLNPLESSHLLLAVRLVSEVSQLHLIYRLGVFAATYRITATLILLHSVLDLAPRFIWTWPTREAVTYPELAWLVGAVALCWAAWTLPGVSQEEEEEEE
ncbi:hypothetical protein JCM3774_002203 [Rhodotorula dairenensis]